MRPLGIVETEFAAKQFDRLCKQYPKFEAYWVRGLSWIIARNPEKGTIVPDINPPRYVLGFNKWNKGEIPRIVIVYRYLNNKEQITIERITAHV